MYIVQALRLALESYDYGIGTWAAVTKPHTGKFVDHCEHVLTTGQKQANGPLEALNWTSTRLTRLSKLKWSKVSPEPHSPVQDPETLCARHRPRIRLDFF